MIHITKMIWIAALAVMLAGGGMVFGSQRYYRPPQNFLTVTGFINPAGLGLKHHLGQNFYATGTLEYLRSDRDLNLRMGAAYLVPAHLLFFRFYGGAGMQISRNDGYQYPYMSVGTNFLFLNTEVIYPLRAQRDAEYRFGFMVKF